MAGTLRSPRARIRRELKVTTRVRSGIVRTLIIGLCWIVGANAAAAQSALTPAPAPRWSTSLSGYYEFDSNPLRNAQERADTHIRFVPNIEFVLPATKRTEFWARGSARGDRYASTTIMNGRSFSGSLGVSHRLKRRTSLWASYSLSRTNQPDLFEGLATGLRSYLQQGVSAGAVKMVGRTDVLRLEGTAARRSYIGVLNSGTASAPQRDPIVSISGSWTHGSLTSGRFRIGGQLLSHSSNNPQYRFAMPSLSASYSRRLGHSVDVSLAVTRSWLRYSDRVVRGSGGRLRQDAIAEVSAGVDWRPKSPATPFVRVARMWDVSSDPFRTFSDLRAVIGVRLHLDGTINGRRNRDVAAGAPATRPNAARK